MEPKKVLFVNLSHRTAEMRFIPELLPYVGGVTMGVKLYSMYRDYDPVVICTGPLNGFFPFASKTCFVIENSGVIEDLYIGGSLSFRLKYSGLDAVILAGVCSEDTVLDIVNDDVKFLEGSTDTVSLGLPGKRSVLRVSGDSLLLDSYFGFDQDLVENKFTVKKLVGFCMTGTKDFEIADPNRFLALFSEIVGQKKLVRAESVGNPSCSGCPLGCSKSKIGEIGGNILVHSLVACGFAENIYSNLGTVFACLDTLGYRYTHEQLEALPDLFTRTLKEML